MTLTSDTGSGADCRCTLRSKASTSLRCSNKPTQPDLGKRRIWERVSSPRYAAAEQARKERFYRVEGVPTRWVCTSPYGGTHPDRDKGNGTQGRSHVHVVPFPGGHPPPPMGHPS